MSANLQYCECLHSFPQHNEDGCTGLDSYDCPCACPSFDLEHDYTDREDHS